MHLTTPLLPLLLTEQNLIKHVLTVDRNNTADQCIGILLSVMLLVAILGNMAALSYFWPVRRKSIHFKLYILIVFVDILTGLSTIPVIASLLNNRKPMMFSGSTLCAVHISAANFLIKYSMFLVALLSVTRAVAIASPHNMQGFTTFPVFFVVVGYGFLLLSTDVSYLAFGWTQPKYIVMIAACAATKGDKENLVALTFYRIAIEIEILLPILIVFITFTVSLIALKRNSNRLNPSNKNLDHMQRRFRQVSITITLFAAIFLLCNIPVYLFYTLHLLARYAPGIGRELQVIIHEKLVWYGDLMLVYFPVVLNATINPCLYLLRMPVYYAKFIHVSYEVSRKASSVITYLTGLQGGRGSLSVTGESEVVNHSYDVINRSHDVINRSHIEVDPRLEIGGEEANDAICLQRLPTKLKYIEANSVEANSVELNSVESNSVELNSVGLNSVGLNSVGLNSIESNSVGLNSVESNSVGLNSI